ncbi:unnamed protein product [Spirodela intermedia]|uniref:Uncharacterized protein n=1 Tax=Spirodela intermedia TaxID=51605 RepID=A0A7I8JHB9_SPIIN|nr:unnamed protein product [Spirodela intermedia]CAA6669550.1 unnamed protein product [Spirodela intermedia]
MVNRCFKYATFIPTCSKCKIEEVVGLFLALIVKLWGIPQDLVLDCDLCFMG